MYSEQNRRAARQRADQEFLRRMMGGTVGADVPSCRASRCSCDTSLSMPRAERPQPPTGALPCSDVLAMVSSPIQCWKELYAPAEALAHGTLFRQLDLPLEVGGGKPSCRTEVKTRRPM